MEMTTLGPVWQGFRRKLEATNPKRSFSGCMLPGCRNPLPPLQRKFCSAECRRSSEDDRDMHARNFAEHTGNAGLSNPFVQSGRTPRTAPATLPGPYQTYLKYIDSPYEPRVKTRKVEPAKDFGYIRGGAVVWEHATTKAYETLQDLRRAAPSKRYVESGRPVLATVATQVPDTAEADAVTALKMSLGMEKSAGLDRAGVDPEGWKSHTGPYEGWTGHLGGGQVRPALQYVYRKSRYYLRDERRWVSLSKFYRTGYPNVFGKGTLPRTTEGFRAAGLKTGWWNEPPARGCEFAEAWDGCLCNGCHSGKS